jgi:hypothetical protein
MRMIQSALPTKEVELPDHMLGSMLPEQISVVYKKVPPKWMKNG